MTEETQGQGFGQEPEVQPSASGYGKEGAPSGPRHGKPQQAPGNGTEAAPPASEESAQAPDSAEQAEPGGGAAQERAALEAQLADARRQISERVGDLQRLQAEYSNYRKRVERDRIAVREAAIANALSEMLPVLDDIGRAREHGELVGGFKSVAESMETVASKMGLQQFGKEGEPFDPLVHEALMHSYSPDVTETTCVQILQPGYRIGERTIRPARVAVAEPQPGVQHASAAEADAEAEDDKASTEESGGPDQG